MRNNELTAVPSVAMRNLKKLELLDLSGKRICFSISLGLLTPGNRTTGSSKGGRNILLWLSTVDSLSRLFPHTLCCTINRNNPVDGFGADTCSIPHLHERTKKTDIYLKIVNLQKNQR